MDADKQQYYAEIGSKINELKVRTSEESMTQWPSRFHKLYTEQQGELSTLGFFFMCADGMFHRQGDTRQHVLFVAENPPEG